MGRKTYNLEDEKDFGDVTWKVIDYNFFQREVMIRTTLNKGGRSRFYEMIISIPQWKDYNTMEAITKDTVADFAEHLFHLK